jgi:hypothetical protein
MRSMVEGANRRALVAGIRPPTAYGGPPPPLREGGTMLDELNGAERMQASRQPGFARWLPEWQP